MKKTSVLMFLLCVSCSNPDTKRNNTFNNTQNNTNNGTNNTVLNNINNNGLCDVNSLNAFRDALTNDCFTASDCELIPAIEGCGCLGIASNSPEREEGACTEGCLNNSSCTEEFAMIVPHCVEQACAVGETFECDAIEDGSAYDPIRFCQTDEDCAIRADLHPCGCPLAVAEELADSTPEEGQGGVSYNLLTTAQSVRAFIDADSCDFTYCQLVDCVQEINVHCGADNRCALGLEPG